MAHRYTPDAPENTSPAVAEYLGGRQVLRRSVRSRLDLVPLVRDGVPYAALERIGKRLGLSVEATAALLKLPRRTLSRRKDAGRLDPQESERVLRLADVATTATRIFGSDGARRWLEDPNRALGGAAPITLLDTDVGAQAVREVLGRIDYGVFS